MTISAIVGLTPPGGVHLPRGGAKNWKKGVFCGAEGVAKIFLIPLAQDILGFFSLVGIAIARFKPKGLGLQDFRLKLVVRHP